MLLATSQQRELWFLNLPPNTNIALLFYNPSKEDLKCLLRA